MSIVVRAIHIRAETPLGRTYSGKFVVRLSPDLHRRAALQAMARGESLNQFVVDALAHA